MKTLITFFFLMVILITNSFSQNTKDISAAVIDFLTTEPKTANKLSSTQNLTLNIVGDLLKQSSERDFQLQHAEAGSNKIIINTNDGRQAQIVKDQNNKVYLQVDGTIYPISQEFINQAEESKVKPNYNANIYKGSTKNIVDINNQDLSILEKSDGFGDNFFKIFDNNIETTWKSKNYYLPHYIIIELPFYYKIDRFEFYNFYTGHRGLDEGNDASKLIEIWESKDTINWNKIGSFTLIGPIPRARYKNNVLEGSWFDHYNEAQIFDITPFYTKYLKIVFKESYWEPIIFEKWPSLKESLSISIGEIKVFGTKVD